MKHIFKLHKKPFNLIQNGIKTIESRLYDEKRKNIRIGDELIFISRENGNKIYTEVLKLYKDINFLELSKKIILAETGDNSIDNYTNTLSSFYSKIQQNKYGVLAIKFKIKMKLNKKLIEEFKNSESKLLAVTKYWNLEETNELISQFGEEDAEILIGLGENRISSLKEKNLEREATHFIGNIQTKEIKYITQYCSTIHSIDNIKQIKKINEICEKQGNWVKAFLQIKLDSEKTGGIEIDEIPKFLEEIEKCENIGLIGFSAIGKAEFTEEDKRKEFKILKELKAKYLQNGIISAGTSRDYKIAIEERIEIIRIGKALVE